MRGQQSRFFYFEQWSALVLGIACLAVFLWALVDGQQAFSSGSHSAFVQHTLSALGWLLTIAVALLGVTLTRFAFYTPPGPMKQGEVDGRATVGPQHNPRLIAPSQTRPTGTSSM